MSMDQLMALVPIEAACVREANPPGRKSRWERPKICKNSQSKFSPPEERSFLPPPFVDVPPGITPTKLDQFLREQRLEELSVKLARGELEDGDPDIRAASPPPIYDRLGNRTNTREVRVRNAMNNEHQRLIEFCVKTIEGFVPPADYRPAKKVKRIMIPQDKYPEYNFMGLIIGPRGCNHKRLEMESGSQISIRGKGTQKEGKKTDQTDEEAAMPQHVHIAADTEEKQDKAVSLIEPLLDPFHPMHEEFKKRGLEQLALVNGVQLARSEQRCSCCGVTGHLAWECPDMQRQSFKKAQVKCAFCGDLGHVTMDCKLAKEAGVNPEELIAKQQDTEQQPPPPPPPPPPIILTAASRSPYVPDVSVLPGGAHDAWKLDEEYRRMMRELSGPGASFADQLDDLPQCDGSDRVSGHMANTSNLNASEALKTTSSGVLYPPGIYPQGSDAAPPNTSNGFLGHAGIPPPPGAGHKLLDGDQQHDIAPQDVVPNGDNTSTSHPNIISEFPFHQFPPQHPSLFPNPFMPGTTPMHSRYPPPYPMHHMSPFPHPSTPAPHLPFNASPMPYFNSMPMGFPTSNFVGGMFGCPNSYQGSFGNPPFMAFNPPQQYNASMSESGGMTGNGIQPQFNPPENGGSSEYNNDFNDSGGMETNGPMQFQQNGNEISPPLPPGDAPPLPVASQKANMPYGTYGNGYM